MSEHFVTCQRMKDLERLTDEKGLSYYQMMENAGTCVFATIMQESDAKEGSTAVVFCGKGNNGGDGFVVARMLCQSAVAVTVVLVDGEPKTEDAITNYKLLQEMPLQIVDMTASLDVGIALLKEDVKAPDIIVDAIYGTGFHGELRPNAATATSYITKYWERAYAIDIPSGLNGDMVEGDKLNTDCAKVKTTITFHAKKPVHIVPAALNYCGNIVIADIGINEE